ncbi:hypothetical protein R3W88_034126 [Solanum pinnatisectum]|uniref:Uncharacterized protein n=1 Tax=Solanum pinnatisectum TaxID=50273 RepID=A0AAV9K247_9SOLN|nr:hypothetical protein R3W88_034126 [Solanum pinnatisectum]
MSAELEHQAYWAIKRLNLDPELVGKKRVNQLHELEEFRLHVYENAKLYMEKMKRWHDKHIVAQTFTPREKTGPTFLVNRQRVKHNFGVDLDCDREALELNDE